MSTFLEGPAPGLSRIFPQSGPTGDMGAPIPISNPSSAASSLVFPSSSASQLAYDIKMTLDSAPTRTLDKACKIQFGVQTSNSVFNFPINASDIDQSTAVYELLSAPPFIPSRTHAHSRSRSWFSDALDEGAWKVESRLLPALKAIVLATQNAKQEDKPYLSDALTFLIAALQEARHMRITAKFGFDAARRNEKLYHTPRMQLAGRARVPREHFAPKDLSFLQRPVFFRERRRPNPGFHSRVGEDWSGRRDYGGYTTDLERKKLERTPEEGEWTMQRFYWREERGASLCEVDTRGVEDGSVDQADSGPGWLREQHFLYPEEEWDIQTNPGLQTAER
ncbi:uncharacterized protein MONOS_6868 [Monocercomonoides exilis]|uniref:uncharacterized protein n=1 Tax=Monocercomonoides exilis TaxID=2049356 RepID=UPI00355A11D2|nr:hypothetical protein MONOS_6868 [Monocercomonoides exilis]|eukprot:MONOS_6868.1-p1 / transcript=MONOS_6868.1 / gene=MONOS_6868 / organism=Monocercomonoides_exilis_PA203 / gene_product=unspecified product / transcript_product=unspecified product / location=Mono_scaffold00225:26725-27805(+) / protein_length=336 / sequence_SO=supercontig / SO=protein_coding / is_pseudo=false